MPASERQSPVPAWVAEVIPPDTLQLYRDVLHGLIERLPGTHRYRLTDLGLRTALFYTRVYSRILRPGIALISPRAPDERPQLHRSFRAVEAAINSWCEQAKIAA